MKLKHKLKFFFIFGIIGLFFGTVLYFFSGWRLDFHRFKHTRYISDQFLNIRLAGSITKPKKQKIENILLLHGSSVFGRKFPLNRMLIKNLSKKGYEIAAFDFRGYGESDDPNKMDITDFDLEQDVVLILRALGWDEYHILGHSLGASVAINAVASGQCDGAISVIGIGPSRRIYERMLKSDAKEFEYMRQRLQEDMELQKKFDDTPLRFFLENANIENAIDYFSRPDHCPLFLIDGELEDKRDLDYLRDFYKRIVEPKKYYTVPGSNHNCKVVSLFTRNKIMKSTNWDIILYKKRVFNDTLDQILAWLDKFKKNRYT